MQNETWKEIKDYEGLYEVSTHGRIKRLAGIVSTKNGKLHKVPERIKSINPQNDGYVHAILTKDGKPKTFRVHRLVAEAFIPNVDFDKTFVNHKDLNRSNNFVDNLEWITPIKNTEHAFQNLNSPSKTLNKRTPIPKRTIEIWHDINGYEGLYVVSNLGRIKRLESKVISKDGFEYSFKERFLTPYLYKNKNYVVKLTKNAKSKILYVHRLVAEAFLSNPENYPFVKHLDGYIDNNTIFNLGWVNAIEVDRKRSNYMQSLTELSDKYLTSRTKNEEWKKIEGYEDFFLISNHGRVKSLERVVEDNLGRKRLYKSRLILGRLKKGYIFVTLSKNGKRKEFSVHRLVAIHFIPNLKNLPLVNHKNAITHDNYIDNLEWTTPKGNSEHMASMDRGKIKPVQQYDLDGNFIREFPSAKKAARECKIKYPTLLQALGGSRSAFCDSFQWKYSENDDVIQKYKDSHEKSVLQYSLEGEFIQTFTSLANAVKWLQKNSYPNAKVANISKACTGIRNYSYDSQWRHKGDDRPLKFLRRKIKRIVQLTMEENYIHTFDNILEAEQTLGYKKGYSGISKTCNKKQDYAHGFKWMYEEDYKNSI